MVWTWIKNRKYTKQLIHICNGYELDLKWIRSEFASNLRQIWIGSESLLNSTSCADFELTLSSIRLAPELNLNHI